VKGMQLSARHIVVVGLARSGLAVARFLKQAGARITITDRSAATELGSFVDQAQALGVDLELGGHRAATFRSADLVVVSPGVPHTLPAFQPARDRGIELIGEMELASRFIKKPIVAVTGTNGKTTVTELVGRMLTASGKKVFVGGNIGNPLVEIAGKDAGLDVVVAEVSSFQLDTITDFHAHVAVLLNITPDHLDRYADFEAYSRSKARIFENQGPPDFAIGPGNDPQVQKYFQGLGSRTLRFSVQPVHDGQPAPGAVIGPLQIAFTIPGRLQGTVDLARTGLIGPHNRENIAAAGLAALAVGGTLEGVQSALDAFQGLPHRIETVRTLHRIRYVNDSKATNVDAVIRALECFDSPVVLIMGGRNKGYDFAALRNPVQQRVKKLIAIGEAADAILTALGGAPAQGAEKAPDLQQAVRRAYESAASGDTVLLSPACASFDMFTSYAERGDRFRRLVEGLS
jgi:UDP-N-acetylmuramoylalanine--D-glutamate ligase